MTTTQHVADRPAAPTSVPASPTTAPRRHLPPDWPLAALFIGYPLWWLIGIGDFAGLAAAAVMAVHLARRGHLTAPRGFALWLLFLVWVVVGILVLQVDAPGAIPGASGARYLTWAYRLVYYTAATVVLLYVGNMRKELSSQRIARIMSWMFVTIVAGGMLGLLMPHLDFPSLLELVLPHRVAAVPFVHAQVHPTVAELQNVLGYENPRPSAPFAYSNTWGLNFACFLPFFVISWCRKDAGWYRVFAPVVLAIAVIPVIFSLNRGLWFSLIVMALFVAVQSALHGNVRLLGAIFGGIVAVVALVSFTSLGTTIEARFSSQDNSNEARSNLGSLAIDSMAEKSAIVGFGSTRNVQGNFNSIAGGATAACPHCSPPALGTQGRLWLVAFSQGFLGLIFYLGFFVLQFLRHIRLRGGDVTVGLSVLLVQSVTLPIYDWSGSALFAVMIAIALLWRAAVDQGAPGRTNEIALRGYGQWVRRHGVLLVCTGMVGILGGGAWEYSHAPSSVATVSVLIPAEPQFPGLLQSSADLGTDGPTADATATTLDTEAQLLSSRRIRSAMSSSVDTPLDVDEHTLTVTADPNTRILNLTFSAPDQLTAGTAVTAAATTLLTMRDEDLRAKQTLALTHLAARTAALSQAVNTVDATARALRHDGGVNAQMQVRGLHEKRRRLIIEWGQVSASAQQVASTPLLPGHIVRPASARDVRNGLPVPFASGLMLGLLLGIGLGAVRDAVGRRVKQASDALSVSGLPVLARVKAGSIAGSAAADTVTTVRQQVALGLGRQRPDAYLSVGSDVSSCSLAATLDGFLTERPDEPSARRQNVVLVAARMDRLRRVELMQESLRTSGSSAVGIILVGR